MVWDFVKVLMPKPNVFVAEESTEHVRLSMNAGNGIISGRFNDLTTGRSTPIKGVALQKQNYARGFFLSTNASGSFTLTPGTSP